MREVERLKVPALNYELVKLTVGDVIFLDGRVYTFRDRAHTRALQYLNKRKKLPIQFEGAAIWHCGPIVKKVRDKWMMVSVGSTTSARMDKIEDWALENLGFKVVIGKGGMGQKIAETMKKLQCVYLATVGGCGALMAKGVREIEGVHWLDLGIPEAIWVLKVEDLGPLIVGIDARGNNLFEEHAKVVAQKLESLRLSL